MSEVSLKERFEKDIDQEEWIVMRPHFWRDALIMVDETLDMADVAVAIAEDKSHKVQEWISSNLLIKPTQEQVDVWEKKEPKFEFLIIQPYVIAREIKVH